MKYDLIISNPPYNSIGNKITRNIVENVDYGCFVNLLPANDYRRHDKSFKLYQFVDMDTIRPVMPGAFKDAYVTTTLCRIMKERQVSRLESEFEINNYVDKSLKKYFYENRRRNHYAIDNFMAQVTFNQFDLTTVEKSFYIGSRDPNHRHLPYSINSIATRYNMNIITKEQVIEESSKSMQARGQVGDFSLIAFDTENEKTNFSNFVYSNNGFRFISKLFTALNVDGYTPAGKYMPKVDWSRPWTVEELLEDYGYTTNEIDEIMKDLEHFKPHESHKDCALYISEAEFEIENYIDKSLKKYFYENAKRNHYAITNAGFPSFEQFDKTEIEKSFYIGHRDPKSCHFPYSQNSITTRYNMNAITKEQVIAQSSEYRHNQGYVGDFHLIIFNTEKEKQNLVNFVYSKDGFRFMSKLFTALNIDSSIAVDKYMPKVDWTKPQTVQSILLDYGYTEQEIDDILDDLKNYRYMDEAK